MSSFSRVLRSPAIVNGAAGFDPEPAPSNSRVLRQPSIGVTTAPSIEPAAPQVDREELAYARGVDDGREAARQQLVSAASALQAALEQGRAQLRQEFDRQRDELVRLAVEMATLVLGHDQHDGGAALLTRLQEALSILDDSDLVISMNEVDLPLAAQIDAAGVTVIADATLQPGEARITGQWAQADLTHAMALQILREQAGP